MENQSLGIPTFNLESNKFSISSDDLIGSPTILVFYPKNNTPVCSSQLALYNEVVPMFEKYQAKIYGISVDEVESHKKFAEKLNRKPDDIIRISPIA